MATLTFAQGAGATLELVTEATAPDGLPQWTATVTAPGIRLTVRCPEGLYEKALFEYLEALNADWRGWKGERVWTSQEAEVRLIATHDGLATVAIVVVLENVGHRWRYEAELHLDAGAFGPLSRAARTAHLSPEANRARP